MSAGRRSEAIAALSLIVLGVFRVQAARVTLQDGLYGYAGTQDTWLNEGLKGENYGGATNLEIRYDAREGGFVENCSLVRFALPVVEGGSLSQAVLEVFYLAAGSLLRDNAMGIKPYRVHPSKNWYENTRNGESGEGANWRYFGREEVPSNVWTYQACGWYDKIDDGNGSNLVKRAEGTVPGAIEPTNWVSFNVQRSVLAWLGGATNNGFILFSCSFQGGGTVGYAQFASRENTVVTQRPRLRLQYDGAIITWTGAQNAVWDDQTPNWLVGTTLGCFDDRDSVCFFDNAAQTNVQVVSSGVTPSAILVSNNVKQLTFYGGAIGGTLFKSGTGVCKLAAANLFSNVWVEQGTLLIQTNGALGPTNVSVTVRADAMLILDGNQTHEIREPLMLEGVLFAQGGSNVWEGSVSVTNGARVGAQEGSVLVLNGSIGGDGVLNVLTGSVCMSGGGSNTWDGPATVYSGSLYLDRSNGPAIPSELAIGGTYPATTWVIRAGQLSPSNTVRIFEQGWLRFAGTSAPDNPLSNVWLRGGGLDSGEAAARIARISTETSSLPAWVVGALNLSGGTLTLDVQDGAATNDLVIDAVLTNGSVHKLGSGRVALLNRNQLSGVFHVKDGEIVVEHEDALGDSTVWLTNCASLAIKVGGTWSNDLRFDQCGFLKAEGSNTVVWDGAITCSVSPTLTVLTADTGSLLRITRDVSGPLGDLLVRGGGTVELLGSGTWVRDTIIDDVVLCVGNTNGSATGGATVYVDEGGVLCGTGIIHGTVNIADGAVLQPGNPSGDLMIGNYVFINSAGVFRVSAVSTSPVGRLDLAYGGTLKLDSEARLVVNGVLAGTNPVCLVTRATDVLGQFKGLPPGGSLPWPNHEWYIHYQPNAIYLGRNDRPVWYFRAFEMEEVPRLMWRTPVEIGVVGFDVCRSTGTEWEKVNESPIVAQHPEGGVYWLDDPTAPLGMPLTYRLVQLLMNGKSNELIRCARQITRMALRSFAPVDGDPLAAKISWSSRDDETYWIDAAETLTGEYHSVIGPIKATPQENTFTIPLGSTDQFYRISLEP